jgi:hypothetical protein
LTPFFDRLAEARSILCTGNVDFVFARNAATGSITVARTAKGGAAWEKDEKYILQVARPVLNTGFGLSQDLLDAAVSKTRMVTFAANGVNTSEAFMKAAVNDDKLNLVTQMSYFTTEVAALDLKCKDTGNAPMAWSKPALQYLTKNNSVTKCDLVPTEFCAKKNMTALRAVCPVRCNCQDFSTPIRGFFAGPKWGCPQECDDMMKADAEKQLADGYYQECNDVPSDQWSTTYKEHTQKYFDGMQEWLNSQRPREEYEASLKQLGKKIFGMDANIYPDFITHIQSGLLLDSSFDGLLMTGYPHPRGLKGCEYWASWEIQYLLGANLCQVGAFRSLRFLCPVACSCGLPKKGRRLAPPPDPEFTWDDKDAIDEVVDAFDFLEGNLPMLSGLESRECPISCMKSRDMLPTRKGDQVKFEVEFEGGYGGYGDYDYQDDHGGHGGHGGHGQKKR